MYLPLLSLALALFFLLALTRPRHALTLLAGLLPAYLLRFTIAGIPTNFFEVSVWLALLAAVMRAGYPPFRRTRRMPGGLRSLITRYSLPVTLVFLFILAATFSTLLTPTPHSFGILKSWILTPIVFGFLVATNQTSFIPLVRRIRADPSLDKGRVGGVFSTLILSGTLVSLIGLCQLGSLDRITSIYDVPNSLALFIAPLIVLSFSRGGCLNFIAGGIMFSALLGTQSLGGIVAVLGTLFIGTILWTNKSVLKKRLYVLIFAGLISFLLVIYTGHLPYVLQSFYNPNSITSLTARQQLWSISGELIKEHPLRGLGLGQFEPAYQTKLHERFQKFSPPSGYGLLVTGPLSEFVYRDPHNWVLSFWLNTGLLGLLAFAALNFLALKPIFFPFRVTGYLPVRQAGWLLAPALALLALLIFGLADTIYWKNDLAALHWMLLLIALYTPLKKEYTTEVR